MIFDSPLAGTIRPDARYYSTAPGATKRPSGSRIPLVTQDFGPSSVSAEPTVDWPGGESNIYGQPIAKGSYPNFHRALDISTGGCGSVVLAAAAGKVVTSTKNASGANVIVIDHGSGFQTRYVHLATRAVAAGAVVKAGQPIGTLGNTGVSSGCHLHFAVTKDGKYVDPWRRLAQNTATDPDEEEPVPNPSTYIPGRVAKIRNEAGNTNVRSGPKLSAEVIRQIPKATTETWIVTCWEKGDAVAGSDQWIVRWNGRWEYVHNISVQEVSEPPLADCTDAVAAAHDAGYAEAKQAAGSAVAAI